MPRSLRFGSHLTTCMFVFQNLFRSNLDIISCCRKSQYLALKIMMAKISSESINLELEICDRLKAMAGGSPYSKHVMLLLDTFEHSGPNGKHRCLVYKPMGSTVASMVEKLPWNPPRTFRSPGPRYPKWMAKQILKHALSGLAFLHHNGIFHGDFQPGNLLFSIRGDLNSLNESDLQQSKANMTKPLERLDGQVDKWGPKYLVISESLHEYSDLSDKLEIKISDLGAGKKPTTKWENLLTTRRHFGQIIHQN